MVGLEINGVPYYYVRNLQGDVMKIIDGSGNVVVQYVYDSWGKVLSVTGSLASTVGVMNPIRYRGYYYDTETNLYYLNSRYYDPETGRFISPDVIAEGGNLYTYCLNDPVNRSDESGCLSDVWKKRIIKIAIGVVATTAAVAITVATGGAALPVVASVVASMAIGAGMNAAVAAIQGDDVGEAAIDGMVDGFMWGGVFAAAGATVNAIASGGTAVKAASSASPINTGNVKVYHAIEGKKDYYGITNNLSRRAAEHARNGRTIIDCLDGSYTRAEARGIEQFLIDSNGGPKYLANKINSIAQNNPLYDKLLEIGEKLKNASKWIPFN